MKDIIKIMFDECKVKDVGFMAEDGMTYHVAAILVEVIVRGDYIKQRGLEVTAKEVGNKCGALVKKSFSDDLLKKPIAMSTWDFLIKNHRVEVEFVTSEPEHNGFNKMMVMVGLYIPVCKDC